MIRLSSRAALLAVVLAAASSVNAQSGPPPGTGRPPGGPPGPGGRPGGMPGGMPAPVPIPDSLLAKSVRVFLDCQGVRRGCDRDFFLQELPYVNWVRDRFDSEVHLLITQLQAGNGGSELTINFLGQKQYAGRVDTLVLNTLPNDADDRIRREFVRVFSLGLAPYIARTPIGARLRVAFNGAAPSAQANPRSVKDPWNFWLYRIDGNVFAQGEQLVKNSNLSGSVSAARTTEKWKINLGANYSYNERDFKVFSARSTGGIDTSDVVILQRSSAANMLLGRTLNAHWTAGLKSSVGFSDILNQQLAVRLAPAMEYNFFNWSEATRRQLTALYTVGVNRYDYQSRTVFNRDAETRVNQTLLLAVSSRQKWGNTNVSVEGQHYIDRPEQNLLTLSGFVDLRLGRGFSLNFRGSASRVRDQIYLAARGNTERDILTQRQQLATTFRYSVFAGASYTFGSIYNTVVNQRFGTLGETGRRFGFMFF
jgi:hypothetical protein